MAHWGDLQKLSIEQLVFASKGCKSLITMARNMPIRCTPWGLKLELKRRKIEIIKVLILIDEEGHKLKGN